MTRYYVNTSRGCTIIRAESEEAARKEARLDVGRCETVGEVRIATKEDLAWISAMGGRHD